MPNLLYTEADFLSIPDEVMRLRAAAHARAKVEPVIEVLKRAAKEAKGELKADIEKILREAA